MTDAPATAAAPAAAPAEPADAHPHANYLAVFGVLCGLTLISAGFDLLPNPPKLVLAALVFGVATAKAYCVMAWFMHLKFEGGWKYIVLVPTSLLGLGLVLALLPDIGIHYYTVEADPTDAVPALAENEDGPGLRDETETGE
ncbi:cytochrome C oxidase subunit IV family protein [Alienimonas sp. DA493]|uniref:cytochrome C oxidase subunit IV family protein n=1 Tax=Alienimonas sp. DA493 TaxID=3373605 RepID=UPI003754E41B